MVGKTKLCTVLLLLIIAATAAGCVPEPTPAPTPTRAPSPKEASLPVAPEPTDNSTIGREEAIQIASDTLPASIVERADIRAEQHGWYWEIVFDNLEAQAEELMPWPLKGPPPPAPGQPMSEPYPGIWQTVTITIDLHTGDLKSGGASQEPEPGPYISREQATEAAREKLLKTTSAGAAWVESAETEAYLRGDIWVVLFWSESPPRYRIRATVNAVTGESISMSFGA